MRQRLLTLHIPRQFLRGLNSSCESSISLKLRDHVVEQSLDSRAQLGLENLVHQYKNLLQGRLFIRGGKKPPFLME